MGTYQAGPARLARSKNSSSTSRRSRQNTGNGSNGKSNLTADQLARGLGWFSIGLGAAELLAPGLWPRLPALILTIIRR
jgi:hypothetical protein